MQTPLDLHSLLLPNVPTSSHAQALRCTTSTNSIAVRDNSCQLSTRGACATPRATPRTSVPTSYLPTQLPYSAEPTTAPPKTRPRHPSARYRTDHLPIYINQHAVKPTAEARTPRRRGTTYRQQQRNQAPHSHRCLLYGHHSDVSASKPASPAQSTVTRLTSINNQASLTSPQKIPNSEPHHYKSDAEATAPTPSRSFSSCP